MNTMDNIIGYAGLKRELYRIGDTLRNRKIYERLGVDSPRGLLLFGEPGVGKSLMATAVIEESGRPFFLCRKDKPNGDFVKEIKETFEKAVEHAPSIVYLDDMDKFANGDERHPNAEEYVTVQSCIDEAKGKDVFVLATVNDMRYLPKSLLRAGRFDRVIEVPVPHGKDAEQIIAHYLGNKKCVDGMDVRTIAYILDGRSCAELETVINEAGLYAGYERAESITMDHFMEACLKTVFNAIPPTAKCTASMDADSTLSQIVFHEAGHAVVSEVLCPGSVALICAYEQEEGKGGFTHYYSDHSIPPLYWHKSNILRALGGTAATEQVFGFMDVGNSDDLDKAFHSMRELVVNNCICGFRLHKNYYEDSQSLWASQEEAVAAEIEKCYRKAKEILACNKDFFHKLASALAEKGYLAAGDVQRIKDGCTITPVAL